MPLSKPYTRSVSDKYKDKTVSLKQVVERSIVEFSEQKIIAADPKLMWKARDFLPQEVAAELQKIEWAKLALDDLHLVGHFYYLNAIGIIDQLEDLKKLIQREDEHRMSFSNAYAYHTVHDKTEEGYRVDCAYSLARANQALNSGAIGEDKNYNKTALDKLQKEYETLTAFIDRYYPGYSQLELKQKKKSSHRMLAEILGGRLSTSPTSQGDTKTKGVKRHYDETANLESPLSSDSDSTPEPVKKSPDFRNFHKINSNQIK